MVKLLLVLIPVLAGAVVGTQRLAKAFKYHSSLGDALFNLGDTPIYAPWKLIIWFNETKEIPALFAITKKEILWLYWGALLGLVIAYLLFWRDKKPDYYGSAEWGSAEDIKSAGLVEKENGIVLGFLGGRVIDSSAILGKMGFLKRMRQVFINACNRSFKPMSFIMHDGPEHVFVAAPSRSGKGVGIIIPTLLRWRHSVFVLDVKGENWEVTAGYRQKVLKQKVLKFEPTSASGKTARFNPLAEVRIRTLSEVQDIQNIANIIVNPQGKADMDHWEKSGQQLLTGVIAHLLYAEENVSLARVSEFLQVSEDGTGFFAMLEDLSKFEHDKEHTGIFREIYGHMKIVEKNPYCHPLVRQMAIDMSGKSENEGKSIVSTCSTGLGLFADPLLARNMAVSDFAIKDIMNSDQAISLYMVIPPSDINRLGPVMRMVTELLVRRNTAEMDFANAKPAPKYKHKMLLLLDEFPAMGRMETLEVAMGFIAGYGLKTMIIVQAFSQINKFYTKDNTVIGNCKIHVYYAPNEPDSAQRISNLLGKKTVEVTTKSRKEKSITTMFEGATESTSYTGRELMTVAEVLAISEDKEIVYATGTKPIFAEKLFYFQMKFFEDRLIPPPDRSDIIAQPEKKLGLFDDD